MAKNTILTAFSSQTRAVVLPDGAGILLYHLATKIKPQIIHHLPFFVKYIVTKKLDSTLRVDKAIEFGLSHINNIDTNEFERFCGVGVVVTPEQIEKTVEKFIGEVKDELLAKRYKFNAGLVMQKVRNELPWADGKAVKNEVDLQVYLNIKFKRTMCVMGKYRCSICWVLKVKQISHQL